VARRCRTGPARRQAAAARARVDCGAVRRQADARVGDFAPAAAAGIDRVAQPLERRLIQRLAPALPYRFFIPFHAVRPQRLHDGLHRLRQRARFVDIFYPQQPGAVMGARVEEAGHRGHQ
jgi:hypothetical protein